MVDKALLDTDIFSEILKGIDQNVVAHATTYRAAFGRNTISVGDDHKPPGLQVSPIRRLLGGGEAFFDDLGLDRLGEIRTFPHRAGGGERIFVAERLSMAGLLVLHHSALGIQLRQATGPMTGALQAGAINRHHT
jgi:hypothetical protein